MIVELRQKSQVTIPTEVLKALNLKTGDKLEFTIIEGKIVIQPVITVPKDQAWFWTENWQKEEKRVDEQVKNGQIKSFDNIDYLIEDLDS
ncbi:MAG: AbrB/MazE/SpoVT family DNA-binding domain-containing protein [Ruminiclostridium sp.]|nr:AbrB/MazE/SpoVT family DNA-binding domain-containing protein [Ruminiclostridium sp.]